ncbi:MAG: tetratricopeptide repeat protein, partial [Longimicrobiales bacterium]
MAESNRDEIAKLEALYANNPDGRVFAHLAEAYRKAGELERARDVLDRGLRRHADYASAHVVFGRVLADQGLETDAASSFQRVLQLDPENLIARRALAESDRAAGRLDEALGHYRELLAHDASDEDVRTIVADLEARVQPPAAASSPAAWSSSHEEESWATPPQEPISIDSTFGAAPEQPLAPEPPLPLDEPLSLDSVSFGDALDLGTVDFGVGAQAAEPSALGLSGGMEEPGGGALTSDTGDVEPASTDELADASGWGDWPGAAGARGTPVDESATAEAGAAEPSPELEAVPSHEGLEPAPDEDVAAAPPEGLSVEEPPLEPDQAFAAEPSIAEARTPFDDLVSA